MPSPSTAVRPFAPVVQTGLPTWHQPPSGFAKLAAKLEQVVRRRTTGRVRDVRVEVNDHGVLLAGLSSSFYGKQLAQHAVMDAIDDIPLTNLIEVV